MKTVFSCALAVCLANSAVLQSGRIFAQTVPASQPTERELAVKAAVAKWHEAILRFDGKAQLELLWDDGSKDFQDVRALCIATADPMLMMMACEEAFGKGTTPVAEVVAKQEAQQKKDLASLTIKISGEKAEVTTGSDATSILVFQDGKWKVDFLGSLRMKKASMPPREQIDRTVAEGKVYSAMTSEIKAGKYRSFDEVEAELRKRFNTLPDVAAATDLKKSAAQLQVTLLRTAMIEFHHYHGRFPTTEEGLAVLKAPTEALNEKWKGPYWKGSLDDPWGNPISYENPGIVNWNETSKLLLTSAGPDRKKGTADDIK